MMSRLSKFCLVEAVNLKVRYLAFEVYGPVKFFLKLSTQLPISFQILVNFHSPRLDENPNAGEIAYAKTYASNRIFLCDFSGRFDY